jgi:hypothetical protein
MHIQIYTYKYIYSLKVVFFLDIISPMYKIFSSQPHSFTFDATYLDKFVLVYRHTNN